MTLDAKARALHVQLSYRIVACSELGIRLVRLRVTPGEWALLVAYHQSQGNLTEPRTFMAYPVVVAQYKPPSLHAAHRRMERMFPNWNRRPRNVRGAPAGGGDCED